VLSPPSPLFLFTPPATAEIYTLSLHDALPISACAARSATPSASPPSCYGHLPKLDTPGCPFPAGRNGGHTVTALRRRGSRTCRSALIPIARANPQGQSTAVLSLTPGWLA